MKFEIPAWFQLSLMLWGAVSIFFLSWRKKERKAATVSISKTEQEVIKQMLENQLAESKISELIDLKVEARLAGIKEMVYDQQQEHFKIKLEMQKRLDTEMKARLEAEQERDIILQQHMNCEDEIKKLKERVRQLEQKT